MTTINTIKPAKTHGKSIVQLRFKIVNSGLEKSFGLAHVSKSAVQLLHLSERRRREGVWLDGVVELRLQIK